ncbi:MAG: alpha/beta hydrolase [Deltaproteobacteria bacterium]|nr:alpha/beta hydrolase [Deltaproteobacteria bacterium]
MNPEHRHAALPGERDLPASDPPLQTIALGGQQIAYADEGPRDAFPVIATHGLPGSHRDYRYIAPQLTDAVRLIRVDMPGFGETPFAAWPRTAQRDRAHFLDRFARELQLKRYGLMAHSMVAGAVIEAAAMYPERVTRVIGVAGVGASRHRGYGFSPVTYRLIAMALRVPILQQSILRETRAQYEKRGFPGARELDLATARLHMDLVTGMNFDAVRRLAPRLRARVLLCYADDDHLVEAAIGRELNGLFPSSELHVYDGASHALQKTRAPEIGELIKQFVG